MSAQVNHVLLHIHPGEAQRDARQAGRCPTGPPAAGVSAGNPQPSRPPRPAALPPTVWVLALDPAHPAPAQGTAPCPQPPRPSASSRCRGQEAGQPGRAGWCLVPSAAPGKPPRPSAEAGERSVPRCPVQAGRAADASPVSSLVGGRRVWGQIPPRLPPLEGGAHWRPSHCPHALPGPPSVSQVLEARQGRGLPVPG